MRRFRLARPPSSRAGTPPCSAADYWKGRVGARRPPPCARPPRPALPRPGAGGHAPPPPGVQGRVHSPGPAPAARLRWAGAPRPRGRARPLPASSARGRGADVRGPTEASLRHCGRGRRAGSAGGRLPRPCGGMRRRRGGPDPAPRTRRAAFPAAPSAPLSQSRAWPAARNRVAELCARSGVGVDGGKPGRPPRARLCARSRALFARSLRLLSTGHETRF